MAAKDGGQQQMMKTGSPRLVTMTAGGNDAGFFGIATNCIYHQDDKDYGKEYKDDPDGTGECAKAIKHSDDYIHGRVGSLENDLKATIDDVLDTENAKKHVDFFLYLTGYAKFFAAEGDWCNGQSFGAYPSRKPKLSQELRRAINKLTDDLNALYQNVIKGYDHKGLRYIDIDKGFDGKRFCEQPTLLQRPFWFTRQYYGKFNPAHPLMLLVASHIKHFLLLHIIYCLSRVGCISLLLTPKLTTVIRRHHCLVLELVSSRDRQFQRGRGRECQSRGHRRWSARLR